MNGIAKFTRGNVAQPNHLDSWPDSIVVWLIEACLVRFPLSPPVVQLARKLREMIFHVFPHVLVHFAKFRDLAKAIRNSFQTCNNLTNHCMSVHNIQFNALQLLCNWIKPGQVYVDCHKGRDKVEIGDPRQ